MLKCAIPGRQANFDHGGEALPVMRLPIGKQSLVRYHEGISDWGLIDKKGDPSSE